MPPITAVAQIFSISTSLIASGGIACLSVFDIPELQSQPASQSLPSIRWLFSRGSHIFPQAAALSSAGFTYLAYNALPTGSRPVIQLLQHGKVPGYLAAAILAISVAPVTRLMIPTNFRLIKLNEEKGGSRSERNAREGRSKPSGRSAEESVEGKDGAKEFTDLSGPQSKTTLETSEAENEEVRQLLDKFGKMNATRAVLLGLGGIVGLSTALL
ncbi:hypothetical protein H2198_007635 [Neophaeococcomyces mojaviensis]|uniref:Uncharacterized protein n=1 Tax=Neophaeococcomyces mojaviensis TaxID=3383035 RepID=A0ACC2ZZZ2_9EURO|nr:hypothetical protein H2198_007635 [Knufia sp. JES_112]